MISKAREIVKDVLNRYYTEHHSQETLEIELVNEINGGRIGGFSQAKRRVVAALDHRLDKLVEKINSAAVDQEPVGELHKLEAVRNELELLRLHVKGMLVKFDE